jgi:hypothetical protein
MVDFNDLAVTSLEDYNFFDVITGEWMYTLEELQNGDIANTQDALDITGRGGRLLNSIKRNKAITITGSNGLLSAGLLESQTGSKFRTVADQSVRVPDYLTVGAGNKATTTYKATGTLGNELPRIYIKNTDSTQGAVLTQGPTAGPGIYTYDPDTKEIVFHTDVPAGTQVIAWYDRKLQANVLTNLSDTFSGKATVYANALAEDTCNRVYRVQFYVPVVDFSGNFNVTMGDAQTVHQFEGRSLPNRCLGASRFWDMIVFGENEADAA